jgi:hypothetical protein
MTKLSLGPIPKADVIRLAVTLPASLKADLDRYAALHAQAWGEPVDLTTLIPHILATFVARDRGFRRASRDLRTISSNDTRPG